MDGQLRHQAVEQAVRTEQRGGPVARAEAAVWSHHGLRPLERIVRLPDGGRLRVLETGSGRPAVFVHGTVGPASWPSLVAGLHGVRCHLVDRPGWGGSDPVAFAGRGPYGQVVADLLRRTLDALAIERAVIVGGSIGNLWALRLAEADPSRVERLVLLGGAPLVAAVPVPDYIRLVASPIGVILVRLPMSVARTRSVLRASGHGPALDDGRIPDAFVAWRSAVASRTPAMRHEREMVRQVVGGSGWRPGIVFDDEALARIDVPTLLVYGTADPTGSVALWRAVADALPRGHLEVIDGAGHMPWFDAPELVGAAVNRFVAEPAR